MKVIVVDDSVVFRMAIKQALEEVPDVQIVGTFSNGQLAVDFLKKNNDVDLVTLDMEMPILDGQATINAIREFDKKVAIIVFSSLTTKGAEQAIEVLSSGANDFVTKEESGGAASIDKSIEMIRYNLLPKIKAFDKNLRKSVLDEKNIGSGLSNSGKLGKATSFNLPKKPRLILMASSTGGPEALSKVFRELKPGNNAPILLVQHMPPVFTAKLASMLSKLSPGYTVKEGQPGDILENNVCYIAPGDFHMVMTKEGKLELNQKEKVCYVRPAANCLFDSVAQNYDRQVLCVVMTGMGDDGAEGVKKLSERGAYSFYQDKPSSTVWGMPAAVERTGKGKCIELSEIPKLINICNERL